MVDTTFVDGTTLIVASWLNDTNDHVYNSTPVAPATTVHPSSVIANTPAGNITSTTTQAAVNELDTKVMGIGQTLQDLHLSRSAGVTYTNSTTKPILVYVFATATAPTGNILLFVNGVVLNGQQAVNTSGNISATGIVPPGVTYSITASSATINQWHEFR